MEKFGRLSRHAIIGLVDGCAVISKSIHCGNILVEGVDHALHILLSVCLFEFDEAAQKERPGGRVKHDYQPQTRDRYDEQGLSANCHLRSLPQSLQRSLGLFTELGTQCDPVPCEPRIGDMVISTSYSGQYRLWPLANQGLSKTAHKTIPCRVE